MTHLTCMPNVGIPQLLKAMAAKGMIAGELHRLDILPIIQANWAFLFTEHTRILNRAGQSEPALVTMALSPVNLPLDRSILDPRGKNWTFWHFRPQ